MDILKEVVEVTYTEIVSVCLLCVTLGIIVAMVIEEFKKQRYEYDETPFSQIRNDDGRRKRY